LEAGSGSVFEAKFRSFRSSKCALDAHNGGVEVKNGALKVYRPMVADSHHIEEEQDPDSVPVPALSERLDPDPL
jgi:hypothetical protein